MMDAKRLSEKFDIPIQDIEKAMKFVSENPDTNIYEVLRGMGYLHAKRRHLKK